MSDYDCFLTQRGLRRVMGDRVSHTFPITIDILLRIFHSFQPRNVFHACIRAAFLVAFFSFLRISNLVLYTLTEVHSSASFFLRRRDITFTASGAYLHVFKTKTIQFKQKILEIPLPVIPNSILCPVTALTTYFSLVPASSDSQAFLAPHGSGFTPILAGISICFSSIEFRLLARIPCIFHRTVSEKGVPPSPLIEELHRVYQSSRRLEK